MQDSSNLKRQNILVTGASSGLGRSVTLKLAKQGHRLFLTGRTPERLASVTKEARELGALAESRALDFSSLEGVEEWLSEILHEHRIDTLYHCAATNSLGKTLDITREDWERVYSTNLLSITLFISKIYPRMVEQGHGKIVLISSVTAFSGFELCAPYVVSKSGLYILWKSLKDEAANHGVRIHLSIPGSISTELFDRSNYFVSNSTHVKTFLKKHGFYAISSDKAADKLLSAVDRDRSISYFPIYARPLCAITRRIDFLRTEINRRFFEQTIEPPRYPKSRIHSFSGRTAIVTGAGSGIGLALTKQIVQEGGRVIALDKNIHALLDLHEAIIPFEVDISDYSSLVPVSKALRDQGIKPSILINNAGVSLLEETHKIPFQRWKRILDINYLGALYCSLVFGRMLKEQGEGYILNIASLAGVGGYATAVPYATSKGALVGFTRSTHLDLKSDGIQTTLVCPSYVKTSIFDNATSANLKKSNVAKTFLSKPMDAHDAAKFILQDFKKGKTFITFPFSGKLLYWAESWLPFISKIIQKTLLAKYFKASEAS